MLGSRMFRSKLTIRNEKMQSNIDVSEAHHLWSLLSNRYIFIDTMNSQRNFTHDVDFKYIIQKLIDSQKEESEMILKLLNKYSIPGPTPSSKDLNVTGNPQVVNDRIIGNMIYNYMKVDLSVLILTLRDAHNNDNIRKLFQQLLTKAFKSVDKFIIYLKMKGWIDFPPLYPYVQPRAKEKVANNEIFLLLNHLIFRYTNIRQTELYSSFASDTQFRIILQQGVSILSKQAIMLEDKLICYGVSLPTRFTETIPAIEDTQQLEEKFMFISMLNGMQNAAGLHGNAIQNIIVNDKIRQLFIDLVLSEIKLIDNMVKFGKVKGWIYITPTYKFGGF